ncbi:AAA family ATPase [Micromonospora rubida]|uniref:Nuclease SbcCD subunit C n=1 Tax=Micromonospora rubida TaxID=2697657 RepID=A0ABW7SGA7_9ACTN
MKPLQLTFSGFRSYVGQQYIDFRGRDLVGIIGDTGAGKSTILMAINFALYGTPTWDAPSPKVLIADGGDGLLVAILEFEARGRPWRVTRQLSRKPTGTFHKLESLDGGEVVHGRSVTQRVVDLVGMDNKTFLRSVLLPQGKFEQLLHASDGERAKILKGLLGLDVLDTVAVRARQHRDALTPLIADLRARSAVLGDPRTTARTAAEDAETIGVQLGKLRAAQTAVAVLLDEEKAAAEQHAALTKLRTAVSKAVRTDAAQRLRQLAALDREILDEEHQLAARAEPLRTRREELLAELGDFRPGGSQAEALTTAVRQLSRLHERITNEAQRRERHQTDVQALEVCGQKPQRPPPKPYAKSRSSYRQKPPSPTTPTSSTGSRMIWQSFAPPSPMPAVLPSNARSSPPPSSVSPPQRLRRSWTWRRSRKPPLTSTVTSMPPMRSCRGSGVPTPLPTPVKAWHPATHARCASTRCPTGSPHPTHRTSEGGYRRLVRSMRWVRLEIVLRVRNR